MILDVCIIIAALVWTVHGYRKGFVRQLFTLIGVLLVVFFSAPAANIIEHILADEFDIRLNLPYLKTLLLTASGCILYLIAILIGKFCHDTLVKGIDIAEKTNHILGAAAAFLQVVFATVFILGIVSIYQSKIEKYIPKINDTLSRSVCMKAAESVNFVEEFEFFASQIKESQESSAPNSHPSSDGSNVFNDESNIKLNINLNDPSHTDTSDTKDLPAQTNPNANQEDRPQNKAQPTLKSRTSRKEQSEGNGEKKLQPNAPQNEPQNDTKDDAKRIPRSEKPNRQNTDLQLF